MNKNELIQLNELIEKLKIEVENNNIDELYNLMDQADSLYSEKSPKINNTFENSKLNQRIVIRCANTIIQLLNQLYAKSYINFSEGIIPLTSAVLENHPKVKEEYDKGIHNFSNNGYIRNTLDSMRLSIELLLKDLCKNNCSLENQSNSLKDFLKDYCNIEIVTFIWKEIQQISKYHNNHVKHDNSLKKYEVEYVIGQISEIIVLLIKVEEDKLKNDNFTII